jgi:5-methylcytosine-specific restriction endonuclease McrA
MAGIIISRADAKAQGLKRYFTGKPCKRGHIAERRVDGKCCTICSTITNARWIAESSKNKEKARLATRDYMRRWRDANPKAAKERQRSHYWAAPDRARDYARRTYEKLKQRKVLAKRAERKVNPNGYREANTKFYRANVAKHRAWGRNYKARKRGSTGAHTAAEVAEILKAQGHRCAYCRTDLHKAKRHVDHIQPLARGGSNDRTNLQWLCAPCNLSKGAKDPVQFVQQELGRLL